MTLAIMQPYLFPYIGYFQLMHAAERFVVYDDVNFMKQGWVNRNRILVGGVPHLFTLPLADASAFNTIDKLAVDHAGYGRWCSKFFSTLKQAYARAPYCSAVIDLVERVFVPGTPMLTEVLLSSLYEVRNYIRAKAEVVPTSRAYGNHGLSGKVRVLDICSQEQASSYVNAIGGMELYDKAEFRAQGIDLHFLRTRPIAYKQGRHSFVPNLSILDVLMWNPPEQVAEWLGEYDLI